MPKKSFSAQVTQWTRKAENRMDAVFKLAFQETLIDANTPMARGGRMRVDTGFLRNSLVAALNARPSGPSDPDADSQGNPEDVALVLSRATIRDVLWAGWSANYAVPREYRDGFRAAAVQKWPQRVREANAEAKRRFK